jgi:hypothetical protein
MDKKAANSQEQLDRIGRALGATDNAVAFLESGIDSGAARALVSASSHLLGGFGRVAWLALTMHRWWPGKVWARVRDDIGQRLEILRGEELDVLFLTLTIRAEEPLTRKGQRWVDWPFRLSAKWLLKSPPPPPPPPSPSSGASSWLVSGLTYPEIDQQARLMLASLVKGPLDHPFWDTFETADDDGKPPAHDYRCPLARHPLWFRAWLALRGAAVVTPVYRLVGLGVGPSGEAVDLGEGIKILGWERAPGVSP